MPDIGVTALAHPCIDANPCLAIRLSYSGDTRNLNIIGNPDARQNAVEPKLLMLSGRCRRH
ncbi:MAG: hypothetical protein IPN94_14915 [Sphingobacteriales bacterium]|nr:hypothetical protein [Sphingobacteriales bacterium]